ncbi:hypothetical protein [Henriciella litoralis]|uniref:hypothetical protein n=1 Tax=Henriciella litoralis TaxID=568102 RepID=UPI0009FEF6E5|nr:hypothetical protein [Henriciella litoralis]
MTAARTNISPEMIISRLGNGLRGIARWGLRGVLALAIVFMAGVIAVITAAVGLIVAAVAVMLRLTGGRNKPQVRPQHAQTDEGGVTLEAHRTARGWTVE